MPRYDESVRVEVHQVKAAVAALEHRYKTGYWPNNNWNEGKCIRLANRFSMPMWRFTGIFGVLTAMKLWLLRQEYRAYAQEDDNLPPWE